MWPLHGVVGQKQCLYAQHPSLGTHIWVPGSTFPTFDHNSDQKLEWLIFFIYKYELGILIKQKNSDFN